MLFRLSIFLILIALLAGCSSPEALPIPSSGGQPANILPYPTLTLFPTVTPIPDIPLTTAPMPMPTFSDPFGPTMTAIAQGAPQNGQNNAQSSSQAGQIPFLNPLPQTAPLPTLAPATPAPKLPTGSLTGALLGLIPSPQGLWAMRPDGTQLTLLTNEPVDYLAVSPGGSMVAYVTNSDTQNYTYQKPFGYTLKLLTLYNDKIYTITSLDAPGLSENSSAGDLDSGFQSIVAYQKGALAWSPDGGTLAFTSSHGAQPGKNPSSDIYLYSPASGQIRRMTQLNLPNGPAHPYNLSWSPDSQHLYYDAAYTFGTGAGYWMAGAWILGLDGSGFQVASGDSTMGEDLLEWLTTGTVLLSSWNSDCGSQNLRTANLTSRNVNVIWPGCYTVASYDRLRYEEVVSVTQDVAIPGKNEQPGVYVVSISKGTARQVTNQGFQKLYPATAYGNPAWYGYNAGQGLFAIQRDGAVKPVFNQAPFDGSNGAGFRPIMQLPTGDWLWSGDGLYVGRAGYPPQQIFQAPPQSITTSPVLPGLYFFTAQGENGPQLYGVRSRDWKPFLVDQRLQNPQGILWTGK